MLQSMGLQRAIQDLATENNSERGAEVIYVTSKWKL